ncbi:MAG TPA: multiheme c-type cytochrome [Acidisarcina sp.]
MTATQRLTPMARTLSHAADAHALRAHPELTFRIAGSSTTPSIRYEIKTGGNQSTYTVTDGKSTLSASLLWAFGTPRIGQSYLFKKEDGHFYEARVTYFEHLQKLDFTPSRALTSPASLSEAMYREVDPTEVSRCFACHSTASSTSGQFDEKSMVPGVTCEACHGPGARHVALMQSPLQNAVQGSVAAPAGSDAAFKSDATSSASGIYNAAYLSPADSVDYCGSCHGAWWDVKLAGVRGPSTARSAPYRLVTSKCWGKGDARLTCTACHDPHVQLQTESAAYDHVCLQCHAASIIGVHTADTPEKAAGKASLKAAGKACPVQSSKCTSCHMQKVYVPEMHDVFTDHRIRIARAGEIFPE